MFVAVGSSGKIITSSDGITFTDIVGAGQGQDSNPIQNIEEDTWFTCMITDNTCSSAYSDTILVHVLDVIEAPEITLNNGFRTDYKCLGDSELEIIT